MDNAHGCVCARARAHVLHVDSLPRRALSSGGLGPAQFHFPSPSRSGAFPRNHLLRGSPIATAPYSSLGWVLQCPVYQQGN